MTELEIVTEAAALLAAEGKASVEYLTAEFSPFSDQFRPDLVFLPAAIPGSLFFVEFRARAHATWRSEDDLLRRLLAHKEFVSAPPNPVAVYAFASDCALDGGFVARLHQHQIEFLGPVQSGPELAHHIREWANKSVRQIATRPPE